MSNKLTRIAVINKDKCKPNKCNFECGLVCPVNRQKKECIKLVDIEDISATVINRNTSVGKRIAKINEDFCIGCGLCAKENTGCLFGAVMIVNVPTELQSDIIHRFGPNGFRLYRMPILKPGQVLGLLGQNGIGKSTIVNILAGNLKPNFEKPSVLGSEMTNQQIISMFKGSEMHKYMTKLYNNELKISIKPQHVNALVSLLKSKNVNPSARDYLNKRSEYDVSDEWYQNVINTMEMNLFLDSKVITLSGGELQRLVCAVTLLSKSNVYIFDEPTNFLDVNQRLNVSILVKSLVTPDTYVVVIEHDLAILDYISDNICIMYGKPSAYGVVSRPMGTASGINTYFDGYIQAENMRFRENEYDIVSMNSAVDQQITFSDNEMHYDPTVIAYPGYELTVQEGTVPMEGSITVVLGKNGTGKTTFINYVAGRLKDTMTISHKPQYLSIEQFAESDGTYPTVEDFLMNNIRNSFVNDLFRSDVVRPMEIDLIKGRCLNELSGGELQRFWIVYALGTDAHVYLMDEASANLDIEQRVIVAKVLKKFTVHNKKIMFIVEHDMMLSIAMGSEQNTQTILVDVVSNDNGIKKCAASAPSDFATGVNNFLKILNVTFHTQSRSKHQRPRINKYNSVKDREQKLAGKYYD